MDSGNRQNKLSLKIAYSIKTYGNIINMKHLKLILHEYKIKALE